MLRSARRSDMLGAAAGIASAVLIFLSVASVDPQNGVSDQELQTWWSDSSNRNALVMSMYTLLLASPMFLLFASRMRSRLRAADANGWADTVFACGIVVSVALGICAIVRGVVASSMRFDDEPLPGVDTLRFQTSLAFATWDLIILFALALITLVSALALTTRALPRWLGWLGVPVAVGCAVVLAIQSAPLAIPLLNIWLLASAVHLARTPATAGEPAWQPDASSGRAQVSTPRGM